jgi:hypothetical protein
MFILVGNADGGKTAKWNETFTFQVKNESEVLLEVWNKNTFGDDLIGKTRHSLATTFLSRYEDCWITIKRGNDKDSGFIKLIMKFQPQVAAIRLHKLPTLPFQLPPSLFFFPPFFDSFSIRVLCFCCRSLCAYCILGRRY